MAKILQCWHLTKEQWGSTSDSTYRQRAHEDWRLCSLLNSKFSSHPHCTLLNNAFQELHPIYLYHFPLSCSYPPSLWTNHHMPPSQPSPGASKRNSSLHTTIFGGRIYLHLYRFILYTLFHFYFFQLLVLLYFYYSPILQLFHYWIIATEVSSCVWVWGGNQNDQGTKLSNQTGSWRNQFGCGSSPGGSLLSGGQIWHDKPVITWPLGRLAK